MLKEYQSLADELRASVAELETLYAEREELTEQSKQLQAHFTATGRLLYEQRHDPVESNRLESRLEELEQDKRIGSATLQGLTTHLEEREAKLHTLLPKACHTFTRLFQTLRNTVQQQQASAIQEHIDPAHQERFSELCEQMSHHSTAILALSAIQIPSGGNWSLIRPLIPDSRAATMAMVVTATKQLCDASASIFEEVERATVEVPEYILGEPIADPVPEQVTLQPIDMAELNSFSEEEQQFIQLVCRESHRNPAELTNDERLVLQNSLQNWRQARLTGFGGQNKISVG
jgi:hypothetical protein